MRKDYSLVLGTVPVYVRTLLCRLASARCTDGTPVSTRQFAELIDLMTPGAPDRYSRKAARLTMRMHACIPTCVRRGGGRGLEGRQGGKGIAG